MKRLQVQRITKVVILLVLLSASIAIAWNFARRQRDEAAAAERDFLSDNVARRSLDFEHSEFRAGNLLFRVRAETDTLTAEGKHELMNVELTTYDPAGNPNDLARGLRAVYLVDAKKIEFQEAVQIRLADGTEIFAERMLANLESQQIEIDRDFRFRRGDAQGEGGAMTYWTGSRRLEIDRGFRIRFPGAAASNATSRRALYELDKGILQLAGDVKLSDVGNRLTASQLVVTLSRQERIERLSARGGALLQTEPDRVFSGATINFEFDPSSGQLAFFDVAAAPEGKATLREGTGDSSRELQADRLRVLSSGREGGGLRLSRLDAEGNALLRFPNKPLREVRAERLRGSFGQTGLLQRLAMEGRVQAWSRDGGQLSSRSLWMELNPSEQPVSIQASGDVEAILPFTDGRRTLSTPSDLNLAFREGSLVSAECSRACSLRVISASAMSQLESERLTASFEAGAARLVEASGGTVLVQEESGTRRRTRSRTLTVYYNQGVLQRAVQAGNFQLDEGGAAGGSLLTGERAAFDPATGIIKVEGGQPQLLRREPEGDAEVRTWARTFQFHRTGQDLSASGSVRSRLEREEGTTEITAGSMRSTGDGWVEYRDRPRLTERDNRLTASVIRLHPAKDLLEAQEEVDSRVRLETESGMREYRIRSQRMELHRSRKTASYAGTVVARSDELTVKSMQLELEFGDTALTQVERIAASGGVTVQDATRTAQGEKSFYFPAEGKVQVFGSPATVVDSKEGKAAGAVLTFFTGDERMLVQNDGAEARP